MLGESELVTAEDLWPAIEARLILAVPARPAVASVRSGQRTSWHKLPPVSRPAIWHQISSPRPRWCRAGRDRRRRYPGHPGPEQRLYRFTELPVQEALESLIPRHDLQAIHWRIGCRLLESMPADERARQAPARCWTI